MSYKNQKQGWAVDRVLELYKSQNTAGGKTVDTLMEDAQKLADFVHDPEMEYANIEAAIAERESELKNLYAQKEHIDAIKLKPASNALDETQGAA